MKESVGIERRGSESPEVHEEEVPAGRGGEVIRVESRKRSEKVCILKRQICRKPLATLCDEFISSFHLVKTLVIRSKSCSDVLS